MKILWLMFFVLLMYQITDVWQTYIIVTFGGVELNPIYIWGMKSDGFSFIVKFKILWALLLVLGFIISIRKEK